MYNFAPITNLHYLITSLPFKGYAPGENILREKGFIFLGKEGEDDFFPAEEQQEAAQAAQPETVEAAQKRQAGL